MRLLLDTHTFIWDVTDEGQLTTLVLELINRAITNIEYRSCFRYLSNAKTLVIDI